MTFSAEVRMATGWLLNQVYDARYGNPATINPAPQWCNFDFFSEIQPGKVHHVQRLTPQNADGYGWTVYRVVKFFHRDKLVAQIGLTGMEFDRNRDYKPLPMWAIQSIRYAERFDHDEPEDWRHIDFPFTHYVSAT